MKRYAWAPYQLFLTTCRNKIKVQVSGVRFSPAIACKEASLIEKEALQLYFGCSGLGSGF